MLVLHLTLFTAIAKLVLPSLLLFAQLIRAQNVKHVSVCVVFWTFLETIFLDQDAKAVLLWLFLLLFLHPLQLVYQRNIE